MFIDKIAEPVEYLQFLKSKNEELPPAQRLNNLPETLEDAVLAIPDSESKLKEKHRRFIKMRCIVAAANANPGQYTGDAANFDSVSEHFDDYEEIHDALPREVQKQFAQSISSLDLLSVDKSGEYSELFVKKL